MNPEPGGPTDRVLVLRAQDGDAAAFDRLIDRHQGRLFRIAYLVLGDRQDSEDVVQETLTDAFLEDVQAKGTYLRNRIEALNLPCFGPTRGMGLMIGIEVKDGFNKSEIANKLIENGLLVLTAGPGMRLLPPLVITKEEMDQGLAIMKKALG